MQNRKRMVKKVVWGIAVVVMSVIVIFILWLIKYSAKLKDCEECVREIQKSGVVNIDILDKLTPEDVTRFIEDEGDQRKLHYFAWGQDCELIWGHEWTSEEEFKAMNATNVNYMLTFWIYNTAQLQHSQGINVYWSPILIVRHDGTPNYKKCLTVYVGWERGLFELSVEGNSEEDCLEAAKGIAIDKFRYIEQSIQED